MYKPSESFKKHLSKQGEEDLKRKEAYLKKLTNDYHMDMDDLVFKSIDELYALLVSETRTRTTKAEPKTLEERDRDRMFEYNIKKLSK